MFRLILFIIACILLFSGCTVKSVKPVPIAFSSEKVDYLKDIAPILDKRCVVCHSCYNSPCQLKLSSFEGLDRGASKEKLYASKRLHAQDPTRLFTDAQTTSQWRDKDFFSVSENSAPEGFNNSIMLQLLSHKMQYPRSVGEYHAESDDLSCVKDQKELGKYLDKHPNRGMPYGFPALNKEEFALIARWLQQGAGGPSPAQQKKLIVPSEKVKGEIEKWEAFFNNGDPKYAVTARYLYEHLFLAHLAFEGSEGEFYELVRSKTPSGEPIELIATVRPYDDPGEALFYYRFRRLHSTIVHKTHMVFMLSDTKLARFNELFIEPEWLETPHRTGYDPAASANPFVTFAQIPPRSRYRFLLDNSHYIIMTFIRGPVCKGQVALNVIHDHFWVMFMDPEHDLSVQKPLFVKGQSQNLSMPIEAGSDVSIFTLLSNAYKKRAKAFYDARQNLYARHYPEGMGIGAIWKGEKDTDAPLLTVYRHFDSASVHRGVVGELPRTMWVIDYPLFERIYYALVAGFDVFGNIGHQTNVRRYMDSLRSEGESYFLDFLPSSSRQTLFKEWNLDAVMTRIQAKIPSQILYVGSDPKREFIEKVVEEHLPPSRGIAFDAVNYFRAYEPMPSLPEAYKTREDYVQGFRAISLPGTAFIRFINGYNANLAYIRIRIPGGKDVVVSAVINRWHDNVEYMFFEKRRLDPSRDTADFIEGFVGSYPNFFLDVALEELPDFLDMLAEYKDNEEYIAKFLKYGVGREEEGFWETEE